MSTSDKVHDGMVRGTLADRKAKPRLETKTNLLGDEKNKMKNDILT